MNGIKVAWLFGILVIIYLVVHGTTVYTSIWNNISMLDLLFHQSIQNDVRFIHILDEQHQVTFIPPTPPRRKFACSQEVSENPSGLVPMSCAVEYAYLLESVRPSFSEEADPLFVFLVARGDKRRNDFASALEGLTLLENVYGQSLLIRQEKIDALMRMALVHIADGNMVTAQTYLDEMDRLGNDNEWDFFQLYNAMRSSGFKKNAIEYLSRSRYFHLNDRISDYIYIIVPELIQNSVIDLKELERIYAYLLWQDRRKEAVDLLDWIDATFSVLEKNEIFTSPHENGEVRRTTTPSNVEVTELTHVVATSLGFSRKDISLGHNTISNGSFETWARPGIPQDWAWATVASDLFDKALVVGDADQQTAYDGARSARISRLWQMNIAGKAPFRAGFSTQIIPDPVVQYHLLSFAYKTDKINTTRAAILFDCFNGITPGDYQFLPDTEGKWHIGILIGSLKERCTKEASLFLANFGVGDVWFDAVSFIPIQTKNLAVKVDLSRPIFQVR